MEQSHGSTTLFALLVVVILALMAFMALFVVLALVRWKRDIGNGSFLGSGWIKRDPPDDEDTGQFQQLAVLRDRDRQRIARRQRLSVLLLPLCNRRHVVTSFLPGFFDGALLQHCLEALSGSRECCHHTWLANFS